MDERCSSYVDFAVKGMMNESRGAEASEFQPRRSPEKHREERNERLCARERANERSPVVREEMKRSRSYTAVNWTSRIRMTDDCRPLTKPHGRSRGECAENTRFLSAVKVPRGFVDVTAVLFVAISRRLADVTFYRRNRSCFVTRVTNPCLFFYNDHLKDVEIRDS